MPKATRSVALSGKPRLSIRTLARPLKRLLPVAYDGAYAPHRAQQVFVSFALQRSGQHVVIDWICRGLPPLLHLNNCRFLRRNLRLVLTPLNGRHVVYQRGTKHDSGVQRPEAYEASLPAALPERLWYSVENVDPSWRLYRKLLSKRRPFVVLIVRDPANWLASSLAHGHHPPGRLLRHVEVLKAYLRYALGTAPGAGLVDLVIDYNRFIQHPPYRSQLAKRLGLTTLTHAEDALHHTSPFGGGSSFEPDTGTDTLSRWTLYQEDPFFQEVLQDAELGRLAHQFFENPPGFPARS